MSAVPNSGYAAGHKLADGVIGPLRHIYDWHTGDLTQMAAKSRQKKREAEASLSFFIYKAKFNPFCLQLP